MWPPHPEPWLGCTSLQAAAYSGHTAVAQSQIAAGAAINETGESDKTALMFAAAGADVNHIHSFDRYTALLYATKRGHAAVVDALLAAGAHTGVSNRDGECALTMASCKGNQPVVKQLLAAGADIEQRVGIGAADLYVGFTPLICATRRGLPTIAEILLEAGANVDATDRGGWTALMHGCRVGSVAMVGLLLAAGADIHYTDEFGTIALHVMCQTQDAYASTIVGVLIAEGANINAVDHHEQTPLAMATGSRNLDTFVLYRCLAFSGMVRRAP